MWRTSLGLTVLARAFLAICGAFWTWGANAQDVASPTSDAEALRQAFVDPPPEYRPLIIAHAGPLNDPDALEGLAARRAGGAVLDAGVKPGSKNLGEEPWNNPTYLDDPKQFEKLRQVVGRLREQGRAVWLYDELGYPSGSAGGRVLAGHPEFQVEVVGCRTFRAADGRTVQVAPRHEQVAACFALPERDGQLANSDAIDLTDRVRQGAFEWRAPEGRWAVCLFERFQPDTWRRHNIPRRNVNILDRRAVARFIELTHERYASELGGQLSEVAAFFTDEPQFGSAEHWSGGLPDCVPMVQWCDELPEAFRRKKGYELRAVLPALFHAAGPATAKYRYDFYDVQSDLVAENYFGQIESWCRDHGVASSGHMLLEESLLFHLMFSGSMLKNWARMDLPGVDLLGMSPYHTMAGWNGDIVAVPEDFSCKMASSVAHLAEKRGTFTESFAVSRNAQLRQVLGVAAWQFAGGITHISTYTIQQQLSAEDYAAFSDFAGRLALLARRGRHVADVAVLVPEASVWAAYTPPDGGRFRRYLKCNPEPVAIDRAFRDTCHALLEQQRDFDCLSEDLLQRAAVADGRLCLGRETFALLILPEVRMLSPGTLTKVREFLQAGGYAAHVGRLPCQSPQRGEDPGVTRAVEDLLETFPRQLLHLADLGALPELKTWMEPRLPRQVRWDGPSAVRLLHRREPGREIVLIANPSRATAEGRLTVPSSGLASIWDPQSGTVREVGQVAPGAEIPFRVVGESALFLVVEKPQTDR
jgi:hypothetical protein